MPALLCFLALLQSYINKHKGTVKLYLLAIFDRDMIRAIAIGMTIGPTGI